MKNISDIKRRIKSISDTRKITNAMETISVVKMQNALSRYESNKAYFETVRKTISNIVLFTKSVEHKAFSHVKEGKEAFIVIASDKGLAGGFNHAVLEFALTEIRNAKEPHLFAVGQMCCEFFAMRKLSADATFADATYDPSVDEAAEMSEKLYKMFSDGTIGSAYIIFTEYGEHGAMSPKKIRLLPFERTNVVHENEVSVGEEFALHELEYEPSAEEVLSMLIPQYLTGMIYGALIQSAACEHSCRHSAMSSATRNATKLLDSLKLEYNRARQESITGELSEIITAQMGGYGNNRE